MNESERIGVVAADWSMALMLGAVSGGSALLAGVPVLASGAALAGFAVGLCAMRWAGRRPRRYRLPGFALPPWPDAEEAALPPGVVRLPQRALPTPGELNARIQRHLQQHAAPAAQVIPLRADAGAALREALAQCRQARS